MKRLLLTFSFMFSMIACLASCDKDNLPPNNTEEMTTDNAVKSNKVRIKIGASTFTATLLDNPTAKAFKALLPLTISMKELNNNEKFFDLPKSLPTNSSVPASIQSGDLMLYGSNTLVLFYKSFSTSYSYSKLGKIEDVNGLVAALGTGNVTVTFEMEE
ncbi:cyclophilin-like fold protein [Runella sp.]